jgi:hypothetical protein
MNYTFGGGSERGQVSPDILPEGDYNFRVLECGEPYLNPNDNWVVKVKLSILPSDQWVWDQPWSGKTGMGEKRDGIGDFLLAIGRATTLGQEVDWDNIVGARGRCRLRQGEISQGSRKGQKRNEVHYYYRPKQVGPSAAAPRQSFTEAEVKESQAKIAKTIGAKDPDLDVEPDDIPF